MNCDCKGFLHDFNCPLRYRPVEEMKIVGAIEGDGSYRDAEGREFIRLEGLWYKSDCEYALKLSDTDMLSLYGTLELKD